MGRRMIFEQVEILRVSTNRVKSGVFEGTEVSIGMAYMYVIPVTSGTLFRYTIQQQSISHEGWARRVGKWTQVRINDIIVYGTHRLKVTEIKEEGKLNGRYFHFMLDEESLVEKKLA